EEDEIQPQDRPHHQPQDSTFDFPEMPPPLTKEEEFCNCTPEERLEKSGQDLREGEICVMVRSSPFEKLLMVECLKHKASHGA
ncbi:hypothetical protein PIB30_101225, partial [Stylosanthes scabra]|nr:hypothetical protein [Stylosanthes scabra]